MSPVPSPDELGPVDVAVLLFEGSQFNGDVAPALLDLHRSGTVRLLDLAFIRKEDDGSTTYVELEDAGVAEAFGDVVDDEIDLLSDEDLSEAAEGLENGSSALVVVWANTWSLRLAGAVRDSGGELIALERIPREIVETALEAAAGTEEEN